MWHSWKSRLFTFGFVAVRCYCFIPRKKLTVVSLISQFYPLGTVYCYKYIYINNIKKIICPVNPFNEIFLYRLWVNAKEFKWCEKWNRIYILGKQMYFKSRIVWIHLFPGMLLVHFELMKLVSAVSRTWPGGLCFRCLVNPKILK